MTGILAGVVGAAVVLRAQSASQVAVAAGSATDERGVRSSAVTVAPSLTLGAGPLVSMTVNGSGTRFETDGWMIGGSATVTARTREVVGTALSLNTGVGVSRSSFGTTLTVADATPAVEWTVSSITLFGGARAAWGQTTVRTQLTPVPAPGQTNIAQARRSSLGPVYGATWRPLGNAGWPAAVSYREERATVSGSTATDRSVGAAFTAGFLSLGGAAGERVESSGRSRYGSGSLSIAVTPAFRFEAATGRYPSDRLTGTAPGRFVSAGVALAFGGGKEPRLPVPRGVRRPANGLTRLSITANEAQVVDVYGDWNDWTPVRARRAANGVWYVDLDLAPGEYRYAFRVNEVEWRVPDGAAATDDGFGGKSAFVTVVRRAATQGSDPREEE